MAEKYIEVTLMKGFSGQTERQQACVRGLGLSRRHQTVSVLDTPANRGMITKVCHLLNVQEK